MQLLQNGKQQWIDQNGLPLANGSVGFYAPGTLNPQATYQDQAGTIQNANPISLDSRGQAIVWGTGTYRQIVKDASGVTIWDQIVDTPAGGAALGNTTGAGGAAYVGFDGGTLAQFFLAKNNRVVDSIAALRSLDHTLYTRAFVTGYYAAGDGGGGAYWYDPSDTTSADNGGTIIVAADGGRWKLSYTSSVSVCQFGADKSGTADSTTAIQAAINAMGADTTIYFPPGVFKVTSQISVQNDRVHLVGSGSWATQILFAPTANATCLQLKKAAAAVLYQGSVRGISFYSNDTTHTKIAIDDVDTSAYLLEDIVISGAATGTPGASFWGGASSVGLRCRGREIGNIRRFYAAADLPIQISQNPNSSISIDHHHFTDVYVIANGSNACITIDSGVNLTHVTFDGYQAWVGGGNGLYWNDTTSSAASAALRIVNSRWEQMNGTTGYHIYIAHNTGLQQLTLDNVYGALTANGIYLRKCSDLLINQYEYIGSQTGFNIDSTCDSVRFNAAALNNPAATVSLTATRISGDYRVGGNINSWSPGVPTGSNMVQRWNPSKTLGFSQMEPQTFTVGAGAIVNFASSALRAILMIAASGGPVTAIMACNGTSNTTKLLTQSDAGWFGTSGGAANYNLYWNGSNYVLQNNTGSSCTFHIVAMGAGEH